MKEQINEEGTHVMILMKITKIAPRIVNGRTLRDYSAAAQAVAGEMEVPFIAVNSIRIEHHNRIGSEASVAYN